MSKEEKDRRTIGDYFDWIMSIVQFIIIVVCTYYAQKLDSNNGSENEAIFSSIDTIATYLTYAIGIIGILAIQLIRIRYVNNKRHLSLVQTIKNESDKTNSLISKPILIRSDFRGEVQNIVNSSNKELLCLLRTGSIIGESYTKTVFADAVERGCKLKIIVCRMHKEIVGQIAFEMTNEVGEDGVIKKFGVFLDNYTKLSKKENNLIEVRTLNYLPSTLKFISDPNESIGKGFIVPVSFKTHVRKAPSILAIKAQQGDILEYYVKEFNKYWDASDPIDKRISFDSSLNLNDVKIRVSSVSDMEEYQITDMVDKFNKYGWVIIKLPKSPKHSSRQSLIDLKRYFGKAINHQLSDNDGITIIQQNNDPEKKIYKSQGTSDHPLHTGGTHLISPPKIIALYCETPAKNGGNTHIMSGKHIFQNLLINNHEGLEEACKDSSITIKRGEQEASKSIFELQENGRFQVTFRKDDVAITEVSKGVNQAFAYICRLRDSHKHRVEFKLEEHEIYIVDNTSVLHGRTSYEPNSSRRVLRLSMDGESDYSSKLLFGFKEF